MHDPARPETGAGVPRAHRTGAAHGGHRETGPAALRLPGCPRLDLPIDASRQAAPLAEGFTDRVRLHQLFPLLVHTVPFGGGYADQAVAAARAALRAAR